MISHATADDPFLRERVIVITGGDGAPGLPELVDSVREWYPNWSVVTHDTYLAAIADVAAQPARAIIGWSDPTLTRMADAIAGLRESVGDDTPIVLCCTPEQEPFARSAMAALGDTSKLDILVEESLYELALHELGHTLGLTHNMRSSQLHRNEDIHNTSVTNGVLTGSVMDYAPVNLAPPGQQQGDFYSTRPGPYDTWAIQFGYDPDMSGQKRTVHLARSFERQLAFGNDADDMRAAGKAIEPRVKVNDMATESIAYASGRCTQGEGVVLLFRGR